jgi:hypothetical protein
VTVAAAEPAGVTVTFAPSREDFLAAARYYYMHRWTFRVAGGAFALMFIIGILGLVVLEWPPINAVLVMLFLPLYAFFLLYVIPGRVTRQLRRNPRLLSTMTWTLTDDNITIHSAFDRRTVQWQTYRRAAETDGHVLLFLAANKDVFDFIPKRAVTSPDQLAALRGLLARRVPGDAR